MGKMKGILIFFMMILLCFTLTLSCKKESKSEPQRTSTTPPPGGTLPLSADMQGFWNFVKGHKAECFPDDESQNCPESVARLLIYIPNSLAACTSFLVADDVIATNYHCIEKFLQKENKDITLEFAVVFPKTPNRGMEVLKVNSILDHTQRYIVNPMLGVVDYAFLKLERKVDRAVTPLNFDGFKAGDDFSVWSYNFYAVGEKNNIYSLLEKNDCLVKQDSLLALHGKNDNDPLIYFSPCNVLPGNSGSPVLNDRGEAIGIIYGGKKKSMDYLQDMKHFKVISKMINNGVTKMGELKNINTDLSNVAPFGLATNFRCLCSNGKPLPFLDQNQNCDNLPESCMKLYDEKSYYEIFLTELGIKAREYINHEEQVNFSSTSQNEIGVKFRLSYSFLDTEKGPDIMSFPVPQSITDAELFKQQNFGISYGEGGKIYSALNIQNYPICKDEFLLSQWGAIVGAHSGSCESRETKLYKDDNDLSKLGINNRWYSLEN